MKVKPEPKPKNGIQPRRKDWKVIQNQNGNQSLGCRFFIWEKWLCPRHSKTLSTA
jgi:hypothetical protein